MHAIKQHSTKIIVISIIAAILSAMLYLVLRPEQASTPSDGNAASDTQQQDTTDPANDIAPPATTAGAYTDYSEEAFNQTEGRRILFFHAAWCPQCRALDASIHENTVPDGVTIFKTDYDTSQELRQKYGVTIQTSLVEVDADGNEVQKFVAYDDPSFDAVVVAFNL
jgi:thiol-disulfide isomerase/thioredoxin